MMMLMKTLEMMSPVQVCRSRNTKSLPFYLILATWVVTGLWTIYGRGPQNNFGLQAQLF